MLYLIEFLLSYIDNAKETKSYYQFEKQENKTKLEKLRSSVKELNDLSILMEKIKETEKIPDDLILCLSSNEIRDMKNKIQNLKENLIPKQCKGGMLQVIEHLLDNMKKNQTQRLTKEYKKKGRTKFERLYNIINDRVEDLKNKELSNDDVKVLIEYYDEFIKEETRLEEVERKQKKLVEEEKELKNEKQVLQDNDRQFDICRKLTVYKNVNKNYELNRVIWSTATLFELMKKTQSDTGGNIAEHKDSAIECVSSPVFLELFTNIVMPLLMTEA